jgi:hypothetical protein
LDFISAGLLRRGHNCDISDNYSQLPPIVRWCEASDAESLLGVRGIIGVRGILRVYPACRFGGTMPS